MKKILEFLKSNTIIVRWTIWYFFILWLILTYLFKFNIFSYRYWWTFFHATLHGFAGFTFGLLVYGAIPVYIATTIITYRKKEFIVKIPGLDNLVGVIKKFFKPEPVVMSEPEPEEEQTEQNQEPEFPPELPPELRVPFMRAKQHLSLNGPVSVYNQHTAIKTQPQPQPNELDEPQIPIPTDFDLGDDFANIHDSIPTFTDINFDTPIATEKELENNTTKYLSTKGIEFETYRNFVATEKYLIYEHSDNDFWIMDGDSWFASGKQIDSPIRELIDIAKQNNLTPVIYLQSTNIMDLEGTITNFESMGIKIIKDLDELN